MDRLEAMAAFVSTVEVRGFSAAARRLGRSAASVTRAVAELEARTGSRLLRRTTRSLTLTEAGARYLDACRRILRDVELAEQVAARERAAPSGLLAVTAPVAFGRSHVRPILDAFLATHAQVRGRLLLVDRLVNLIEEGLDVAVRIAHLADSGLVAVKVGEVRRVWCASPAYLSASPRLRQPADLLSHECIAFSQSALGDAWHFRAPGGRPRRVKIRPRLSVNTAEAAIASAVDGHGVTSALSYQVEAELARGRLIEVLSAYAPEALPVHVVHSEASAGSAKIAAFVALAVPRLRALLSKSRRAE